MKIYLIQTYKNRILTSENQIKKVPHLPERKKSLEKINIQQMKHCNTHLKISPRFCYLYFIIVQILSFIFKRLYWDLPWTVNTNGKMVTHVFVICPFHFLGAPLNCREGNHEGPSGDQYLARENPVQRHNLSLPKRAGSHGLSMLQSQGGNPSC